MKKPHAYKTRRTIRAFPQNALPMFVEINPALTALIGGVFALGLMVGAVWASFFS